MKVLFLFLDGIGLGTNDPQVNPFAKVEMPHLEGLLGGNKLVVETLSVIFQVGFFKITGGKRIFKMAPLHHHFELKGWPEPKVIVRFWIVSIALALLSMSTLKLR